MGAIASHNRSAHDLRNHDSRNDDSRNKESRNDAARRAESSPPAPPHTPAIDFARDLPPIAQRALVLLGADGVAIALDQGEVFVCRAVAGDIAPPVGVTVDADAGLTGECIATGRLLICADTANDKRVQPSVAASGIRGVLLAPITRGDLVLGVVEAFSTIANAFGPHQQAAIKAIADEIAALLPAAHPGRQFGATPFIADSPERHAIPGFLYNLTAPPPKRPWKLWVAGSVLLSSAVFGIVIKERHSEGTFATPVPVSETSKVDRAHMEVIKASAEKGNVGAQSILAIFYWTGRGVKQDNEAAYVWSAIAAENGDANSRDRLKILRASMSPESVSRAEAAKTKWLREHGK